MEIERLRKIIKEIYNEGLFSCDEDLDKNKKLNELKTMTDFKNIEELFYSDMGTNYIYDTIIRYEKLKSEEQNDEFFIKMIDQLVNNIDDLEEYEVDLFCKLLAEKLHENQYSIYEKLFNESRKGLLAKDIYSKLSK